MPFHITVVTRGSRRIQGRLGKSWKAGTAFGSVCLHLAIGKLPTYNWAVPAAISEAALNSSRTPTPARVAGSHRRRCRWPKASLAASRSRGNKSPGHCQHATEAIPMLTGARAHEPAEVRTHGTHALRALEPSSPLPFGSKGTDLIVRCYQAIATTSTAPITVQQIALPRSPANQNPLAALKQRTALVHPLTNAPGLLSIFRSLIGIPKSAMPINPASSKSCL